MSSRPHTVPTSCQEHPLYNNNVSSDLQRPDELNSSKPLTTMSIPAQARRQTAKGRGLSYGQYSRNGSSSIIHFQDSTHGKPPTGTPRRRGPLKERSREGMRMLRSEGGACWRCKILKKQVGIHQSALHSILC